MQDNRQQKGRQAEQRVREVLLDAGYSILAQNWSCPIGELDLVAEHQGEIVFVEVRARYGGAETALESVGRQKQARLRQLVGAYLDAHSLADRPHRVDVAVVDLGSPPPQTVEIIEYAIGW